MCVLFQKIKRKHLRFFKGCLFVSTGKGNRPPPTNNIGSVDRASTTGQKNKKFYLIKSNLNTPQQHKLSLNLIKGIYCEIFMKRPNLLKQFNKKLIVSGNILEIYEYEKPVAKGFEKKRAGRANSLFTSSEIKAENRKKTAQRARTTVRRYANANPQLNKFFTLTFAENQQNLDFAHYELDKFIKRLKTRFKGFQFINVVEFQKRGAIHFHLLCNLPYVPVNELENIWKQGFVRINRIDNVDNVGAYITKYMTKDNVDERLVERKCYSMSKNLCSPDEYTKMDDIDEILDNLENVSRVHTSEFESEYYGIVRYTQIVCTTPPQKPKRFRKWFNRFKDFLTLMPDDTPTPFNSPNG